MVVIMVVCGCVSSSSHDRLYMGVAGLVSAGKQRIIAKYSSDGVEGHRWRPVATINLLF